MRRFIPFSLALFFLIALPVAYAAPVATTVAASNISATSATLNGTVNANGWTTTVSFDYGLTAGYGTNLAATTGVSVGVFDNDKAVAVTVTGLTCATTYHFRASAVNNDGTTNGGDLTFTTSVCPVNGVCGSAHGTTVTGAPASGLCSVGTASTVTSGNTSFTWSCAGTNGGNSPSCSATRNYAVTTSVSGGNGTVSASQNVAYNATPTIKLTPAARYIAGPVSGTCGGSLSANSYTTQPIIADCTVVASFVPDTVRNALFVNASTSANKTSVLRLINPFDQSGSLMATAYSEAGSIVGAPNASLGTLSAQQTLTLTSAQLESSIGYLPSSPTSKYRIVLNSNLAGLELVNFVRDNATGDLTLGQTQIDNRLFVDTNVTVRNALVVHASSSTNKTSVLRIVNTGDSIGAITATAYSENGAVVGQRAAAIGTLGAQQMLTLTSAQVESMIGYSPAVPTAKYRIAFTANLPSFELINFTRDNATGNLLLAQSQIDNRPSQAFGPSVRQALVVNASSSIGKASVIRVINPSDDGVALTATAYNEAGSVVGTANTSLGILDGQQTQTFTSAQLESALGYTTSSATAMYRIVFTSSSPNFEVINCIKDLATGNLMLAQAQIDYRVGGVVAASSTRNALMEIPSSATTKASEVRVINLADQGGTLSATAYDETGTQVGSANASLGTLGAQQTLTFSAAQLESALGYQPASSTARYRIVFAANMPSFEVVNYIVETATGKVTLAQAQID